MRNAWRGRRWPDSPGRGRADLAIEFAGRFALESLLTLLDLPEGDADSFAARYLAMKRGVTWEPRLRQHGLEAAAELHTATLRRCSNGGAPIPAPT